MKQSFKLSLLALFVSSGITHAANPVSGWYAGIMLGGSYAPKINLNFINPITRVSEKATLSYSGLGNIAGQVGYRFFDNYRLEGQLLYNSSEYQTLTIGGFTINSPSHSTGLRMKGSTGTGAFMFNGFYDFVTPGRESSFSPYVGLGVGYARVNNTLKLYFNNELVPNSRLSNNTSSPAIQAILGAAYFLDDFTWFGLDFRYLTTKKINDLDSRVQFGSINLSFNGIFNCA